MSAPTDYPPSHQSLVIIEPADSWAELDLRDLWAYRELLYFLTWRDVKVRYKQTAHGAALAILQPLCTMLISTVLSGRIVGMPLLNGAPRFSAHREITSDAILKETTR